MTAKFRARRLWIIHASPLMLIAGVLFVVPYAWPYFHRWSWAFPVAAFVIIFGSIHIVTFEERGTILFRKYLSFFPLQKLEMRELRLQALGDDWDGEDETKLDHIHVGPDPMSKHWFSCDKPDEVAKWIRSSLRLDDVRLAPPG